MKQEIKARTSARIQSTKRSLFQRIARILTHRLFFDVLFMLVQIAVLAVMILAFSQYFTYFYGICILLTVLAVIAIIARPSHPDYKIAWIVPIMASPSSGGLLYLLFGGVRLSKRTRKRMERLTELQQETMGGRGKGVGGAAGRGGERESPVPLYRPRQFVPAHLDTQTWYYPTGEALYARMLTELEQAEHSIFLEYFIIHPGVMWDGILEILERKAAQGVDVRVLYDDIGACSPAQALRQNPPGEGYRLQGLQPFRPGHLPASEQPGSPQDLRHRRPHRLHRRGEPGGRVYQRDRAVRPLEGRGHLPAWCGGVEPDHHVPVHLERGRAGGGGL